MQNEIMEGFRLSPQQERLWLLQKAGPRDAYRAQCAVLIEGTLDRQRLEAACAEVVRRHEILRTGFHLLPSMNIPVQVIADDAAPALRRYDLRALDAPAQEQRLAQLFEEDGSEPFDFDAVPLLRLALVELSAARHVLFISLPAMCADRAGLENLAREVGQIYLGRGAEWLPEEPMQYADIAEVFNEWVESEETEKARRHWRKKDYPRPHDAKLAAERQPPGAGEFEPRVISRPVAPGVAEGAAALARASGTTAANVLLACWQILLWRLSGEAELVIGTVYDCRTDEALSRSPGLFARHLPIDARPSAGTRFGEILRRVDEATREADKWQDFFTWAHLAAGGDGEGENFFPFAFEFSRRPDALADGRLTFTVQRRQAHVDRFKIKLSCAEDSGALTTEFHYDANVYEAEGISRLAGQFHCVLERACSSPATPIERLEMSGEAERRELLEVWNDTAADYPLHLCLHQLFEEQAARTPDADALIYEGRRLTYGELNQRANRLAQHLRALGVGPDTLVAVMADRSFELVVAILATLKAGGAYLPLDPSYPPDRLRFMLEDSGARVLLTQRRLLDADPRLTDLAGRVGHVLDLDAKQPDSAADGAENPSADVLPENLAYVIYTSGSTGRPKGVMIPHRAIANRLLWMRSAYPLSPADRLLQKTPVSFDASVWELFAPLLSGARLVLARPGGHRDSAYLVGAVRESGVTVLQVVPSMLGALCEEPGLGGCATLREVWCGGEALAADAVRRLRERLPGVEVHNLYGPTEAAIDATHHECAERDETGARVVSLGRPIGNVRVLVLDAAGGLAAVGVAGELHIGGVGLARGYLNRAGLTAEKFVPNPFSREGGERLYRTGDLARYLPGGEVEFLGRIDDQVKIRGFRIELGEVESVLSEHEGVREAVVVAREEAGGGRRLVAYVVAAEGREIDAAGLRAHLRGRLPEYMVPAAFVLLEELPRTPGGKLDRRALPPPHDALVLSAASAHPVPSRSPAEEIISGMFAHLLSLPGVSVTDNFFDLGGHSLLATQLVSWLRDSFGVEIPLRSVFETPTAAGLAEAVEGARRERRGVRGAPPRPVGRAGALPLSYAQQRLWFLDQLEPGNTIYNIPVVLRLEGPLDLAALERSLKDVVRRQESLRTVFRLIDRLPTQAVLKPSEVELPLRVSDISERPEGEQAAELERWQAEIIGRPFDMDAGLLWRAALLRLGDGQHVFILSMHHIISDGWSMGLFIGEVAKLYEEHAHGTPALLPELPVQYADFAAWQREWLQGEVLEEQLAYWRERLTGAPAVLELPTDRPRPAVQTFRGAVRSFLLPGTLLERLRAVSREEGVTLFMTLLAAFQALLSRYTGQTDISVGTPIAGRNRIETEGLIGDFANTLVMRTNLSGGPSFREALGRVREVALGAYAHQDLPFEKLVEELHPERDLSHHPLFQVLFSLQNTPVQQLTLSDVTIRQLKANHRTARFDLSLDLWEVANGLVGACEYNTDLFEEATVNRLLDHFQTFLENASARPDEPLHALPFLAAEERDRLLGEWNQAPLPRPREQCLHEVFETQAARHADDIALVCGAERLTFAELNRRANRLAHYLRGQGVGPDTRVGICVERGTAMIVGLLGILKAGGAYVPLDIAYPRERLAFMLKDAGVALLLTSERVAAEVPGRQGVRVLRLDADWGLVERESASNPDRRTTPDNLAYVIYTSGSTGTPKGVQVEHGSVLSLLEATRPLWDSPGDVWTVFHSYAFDFSVWEIWACLLGGGRLVIVPSDAAQTPAAFLELLRAERVTVLNQTPSALRQLTSAAREKLTGGGAGLSLRLIVCGGEALPTELVPQLCDWGVPLWNFYGPTEATVWATAKPIEADVSGRASYPIGRALANTQVYVLDRNLQLVPAGVAGELHIGGAGLARGYLNRPGLTAERFVPHPFSREGGERLYRTGDLARHLPNGEVEFLGRIDHQVKVRGFRIELGEIEAVLAEHEGVREAAVVAREEAGGEKRLVAYFVAAGGREAEAAGLRAHLRGRLPEYMVPSAFVRLDELPLSPNGKLDRRALPPPVEALLLSSAAADHVAARTPTEEIICGIFVHLLRLPSVSVADNFFDLGGHSLVATQVVSWIRDSFGVEIPLRKLFESPTVAALAEAVEEERRENRGLTSAPLRRVERGAGGTMPLSFAQQRLWFLDQLEPGNTIFNIPVALRLEGPLDLAALERTFSEVVRRHEVLRTRFAVVGREPVQIIEEAAPVSLALNDLSRLGREERAREVERLAGAEVLHPFDLSGGALWRAGLLRLGPEEHVLLVTMHHIVSDGWSMGVLVNEVSRLYGAYRRGEESPLGELPIQYADYAVWQREYLSGETLEEELAYWRERLRGAPAQVTIPPSGHVRPAVVSGGGARHPVALGAELSRGVRELARASGATPFVVLMAAFQWLVAHHSGSDDVVVGTDVANRTRREAEPLIGFFVNQLALRCRADDGGEFRAMVRSAREAALGGYERQEVPFEKVVEAAGPERRAGLSPIFQLKLNVQNVEVGSLSLEGLKLTPMTVGNDGIDVDLMVVLADSAEGFRGWIHYRTDLYEVSTITRVAAHFEAVLRHVTARPEITLGEMKQALTEMEEQERALKSRQREEKRLSKLKNVKPVAVSLPLTES